MNIILDTHIFLWYVQGDSKLSPDLRRIIEISADQVDLSMVSLWEVAFKINVGKLELRFQFSELESILKSIKIDLLNINIEDLKVYQELPLHHRDPFDRLIIAQAKRYSYTLVSQDANFKLYDVTLLDQ